MFAASELQDISLNQWIRKMPTQMATAHLNLSVEELAAIPAEKNEVLK
jgi:oxalate decarboxylase